MCEGTKMKAKMKLFTPATAPDNMSWRGKEKKRYNQEFPPACICVHAHSSLSPTPNILIGWTRTSAHPTSQLFCDQ